MQQTESVLIILQYERLPDFRFACGRLAHTIRACDDVNADTKNLQFGVWLKAGRTMDIRRKQTKKGDAIEGQGPTKISSAKEGLDVVPVNTNNATLITETQPRVASSEVNHKDDDRPKE